MIVYVKYLVQNIWIFLIFDNYDTIFLMYFQYNYIYMN